MYIGNLMLLVLNLPLAPVFASLLRLPYAVIAAGILGISVSGVYSLQNSMFDVWVAVAFGVVGYLMKRFDYPAAPLVLALVLGPLLERSLRQSLTISHGSFDIFVSRQASLAMLVVAVVVLAAPLLTTLFRALFRTRIGKEPVS
jgi:putative tricarboxylic transport membrane protein